MTTRLPLLTALLSLIVSSANAQQPPAVLAGHTDAVSTVRYSHDGQLIVTGSFDKTLKIYDAAGGEALRTLAGHNGQVLSLAVSPNDRHVVSGSRDQTLKIWDLYHPAPLQQFVGHAEAVSAIALNSGSDWFVTGGNDMVAKVWQRADGMLLRDLVGHEAAISRVAIRADDTQVATGDAAGSLRLWNATDGTALASLGAHVATISGLAFHPTTDTMLSAAEDGTVKLWSLPPLPSQEIAGHTAAVTSVAVSADGQVIVTAGADEVVQVVNGESGELLRVLEGKTGAVQKVVLTADAALAASASADGIVKLWNVADGADRLTLKGHTGAVNDIAFPPTGDQIASAGADGTVRLWRLPVAARPLAGHTMPVTAVATSTDGKWIATGSVDKGVKIWTAADGMAAQVVEGHAEAISAVAFRKDDAQVASADINGVVQVSNVADGVSQGTLLGPTGKVSGLHYSADGTQLISVNENGTFTTWGLPVVPAKAFAEHTDAVTHLAMDADGKTTISGSADATVRVFDAMTGMLVRQLAGQTDAVTALDTASGLVATGNAAGTIRFWNLADGADRLAIQAGAGAVNNLAIHPQGSQIATAGEDGVIRIWKIPVPAATFAGTAFPVTAAAYSTDGTLVAAAGTVAGKPTIVVRNTADGAARATLLGHAAEITSLSFSADKTKLVSGSADKTARVWNLADPKFPELANFAGHDAAVTAVAFSADGQQVFSGAADNSIKQWQVADAVEIRALAGHTGAISDLAVVGTVLLSGSADQSAKTWNTATGAVVKSLAHGAAVSTVALSPDGKLIATGGAAKTVKLWSAADGAAVATLSGHAGAIQSVAFDAGSQRVASCAEDGIRIWDDGGLLLEQFGAAAAAPAKVAFEASGDAVLHLDATHNLHATPINLVSTIASEAGAITGLDYSPDGTTLFSGGADKVVRQWTVETGQPAKTFAGPTDAITCLDLSDDGMKIIAGCADKSAYVWPVAAAGAGNVMPETVLVHAAAVAGVSAGLDGTRVATSSDDAVVRVWDSASGDILEQISGHAMPVQAVLLSTDNKAVLSASADKTVRITALTATRVVRSTPGKNMDSSLSADGAWLVTASDDKFVRIWNTTDGQQLFEVATGAAALTSISLKADKTQLAGGGADMNVQVWPLTATAAGTAVSITTPSPVLTLRYNSAGTQLAVSGADGQLRVYDPGSGVLLEQQAATVASPCVAFSEDGLNVVSGEGNEAVVHTLSYEKQLAGHEGEVTAVAYTADGASLISAGMDKTVRLWNLADGTQTRTFTGATDVLTDLSVATEGMRVAASSVDKNVYVWDLAATTPEAAPLATLTHAEIVTGVEFSGEASRLATSSGDGVIRVWDLAAQRELERFAAHTGAAQAVSLTADGKMLVSGGADKLAKIHHVSATRVFVADQTQVAAAQFVPDGTQIVTAGSEMLVKLWGLDGTMAKQLAGAQAPLTDLAVRPDAAQVVAADAEGRLLAWTVADGTLAPAIETASAIHDLSYSSDGGRIVVGAADNAIRVYSSADGALLQQQTAAAPVLAVCFTSDGADIVSGSEDHSVSSWGYAAPTAVRDLTGHTGPVYSVAYSSDGSLIASASADQSIRIWDVASGMSSKQLSGHVGAVYGVRFSADGKQLLSAGADGTARIWDTDSGNELKKFAVELEEGESAAPVFDAAISTNGQIIATGDALGHVRLWNAANAQVTQLISDHEDAVYRVEFNADGSRLLTSGHAGTIFVWNVSNAAQVANSTFPAVTYSASYAPDGTSVVAAGADHQAHVLKLP